MIDGELRSLVAKLALIDDRNKLNDALYEAMDHITAVPSEQQATASHIQARESTIVRARYIENMIGAGALGHDPVLPALLARHEIEQRLMQGCGEFLRGLPGLEDVGAAAVRAMVLGIATPFVNLLALRGLIQKEPMIWGGSKDDSACGLRGDAYLRESCNTVYIVHPHIKEIEDGAGGNPLYTLMLCSLNYEEPWFTVTPTMPADLLKNFGLQCEGDYSEWFVEVICRGEGGSWWSGKINAKGLRKVLVFIEPEKWGDLYIKREEPKGLFASIEADREDMGYGPITHYGERELEVWWKHGIAILAWDQTSFRCEGGHEYRDPSFKESCVFEGDAVSYDVHHGMFLPHRGGTRDHDTSSTILYFDAME